MNDDLISRQAAMEGKLVMISGKIYQIKEQLHKKLGYEIPVTVYQKEEEKK